MESNSLTLEYGLGLVTLCGFQGEAIKGVLACLFLGILDLQTQLPWYEEAQGTTEKPSIGVLVLNSK